MERLRGALPALIGAFLFGAALLVLRHELGGARYHALSAAVLSLPPTALIAAFLLTAANYSVLTGYDQLSFVYIGRRIDRWRISAASFLAYAVANNVGFAMLSGASVRYRFYSRWGTTPAELSRIVLFYSTTFWLGLLVLGGGSLAASPPTGLAYLSASAWARPLGAALLLAAGAYALLPFVRRAPMRLFGVEIMPPAPRLVAAQFAVSILDWLLAAATLFVLLPGRPAFVQVVGAFVTAQLLGLVSHVPGGLGVFESTMVLLLKPGLSAAELVPSLLAYRAIYYLAPLGAALAVLAYDEARERWDALARARAVFGALTQEITPRVLAIFIFLAGAVLLFSGATPTPTGRLAWLGRVLPLGLVEVSHFAGSLVGVCLLLVSQGVSRRLDMAFYVAAGGLSAGIAASLLRGGFEEAAFLGLTLLALTVSRRRFDRPAAFFETRFSAGWVVAVLCVVGATLWLGFFSYEHIEYSGDLWWQFELKREVSRFLRGSVGTAVALLTFGVARLLRPAPPELVLPTQADLADAGRTIGGQRSTSPYLVYLRDKAMLWNADRSAFVMYGVQGRTWVALGDPVGAPQAAPDLVRNFLERADDYAADGVFYEVSKGALHVYADFGLTFVKVGENASVPLASFSVQGPERKPLRNAVTRLAREGGRFRVIAAQDVAPLLPELGEISSAWLAEHKTAEKGFSLGVFDPEYLARFPVGVVERDGRIEAFANLWPGADGIELALDLMRFRPTAPKNVMEALFVHLMEWGREQGYERFALGMAPLSGFERSPVAPLWMRLGRFLYSHGEALYNFQGLRAFKEKFQPDWEPRYLAYPGGLALPRILADVAALIAGGYRRIFAK